MNQLVLYKVTSRALMHLRVHVIIVEAKKMIQSVCIDS